MKTAAIVFTVIALLGTAVYLAALSPAVSNRTARTELINERVELRRVIDSLQSFESKNNYPAPSLGEAFSNEQKYRELAGVVAEWGSRIKYFPVSFNSNPKTEILRLELSDGRVLVANTAFAIIVER